MVGSSCLMRQQLDLWGGGRVLKVLIRSMLAVTAPGGAISKTIRLVFLGVTLSSAEAIGLVCPTSLSPCVGW